MQNDDGHETCPWMKHKTYRAVRALTAVIVLIFVFWCGFQLGEIRAMVQEPYHNGLIMRTGWTGTSGQTSAGPMLPVGVTHTTGSAAQGTGIVN